MKHSHRPYLIGVTGGIGSGKSTVCDIFRKRGAEVFVADDVAKEIMQSDPEVRFEIERAFGAEAYFENGDLNRRYLAGLVFQSQSNVDRINEIVHPRVRASFRKTAQSTSSQVLLIESALLVDSPYIEILDAIILVEAPELQRIDRVASRDVVSRQSVRERMNKQPETDQYKDIATHLVVNDGSLDDLEEKIDAIIDRLPVSIEGH